MHFVEKRKFKSKFLEYQHGSWRRKQPSCYVTLETVIPEMPTDMIEKPDKEKFEKQLDELTQKRKKIDEELSLKNQQFNQVLKEKKTHIDQQKTSTSDKNQSKDMK